MSNGKQKQTWNEIAAGTQVSYNPALLRALDEFGDYPIRNITPLDLQKSLERMAAQMYAHHSVAIYLSVLNQIFEYAVLQGDRQDNPAATLKVPKGLSSRTRECPEDEALEAIRQHVDDEFGLFAYMLLYTGLRRGELLALQWRDVDFKARTIHVTKSVTYAETGNQPVIKYPKTEAGNREVVLLDRLAKKLFPLQRKGTAYIFGGERPLTQSVYRSKWRNYCLDAGLWEWKEVVRTEGRKNVTKLVKEPSVTPHQLRHAFATMCYEAGIAPKDAQQLLGHSKVEVTMDTYTHIRKNRRDDIADKLNKAE
ncbi:MAG: site-specific integrase [Clostridiales bacterium]|nr:site-specific integrase [Clostridiales bacterium]